MKRLLRPVFQKNIYPDSVVLLRGTRTQVDSIIGKLTNDELSKSHWMPVDLERRYNEYEGNNSINNFKNALNQPKNVIYPTIRFFQENKTEIFELDCDGEKFEMFESMRIYIERDGRPYNYLSSLDELNHKRDEVLHIEE